VKRGGSGGSPLLVDMDNGGPACHLPPTPSNSNTMFIVKLGVISIVVLVVFNIAIGWLLYKRNSKAARVEVLPLSRMI